MIKIISATSGNNLKLAKALEAVVKELGGEVSIINLEELNLPLYTPPLEKEGMPEKAAWLTSELTNSKGTVWLAPEYNGSLPPVVCNAVAWVSRAGLIPRRMRCWDSWMQSADPTARCGRMSVLWSSLNTHTQSTG